MRPANRLLGIIGRGGASQLHVQSTNPPIRYLVDSKALISFGNGEFDFKSKLNDVGEYGHAIDAAGFLRTGH